MCIYFRGGSEGYSGYFYLTLSANSVMRGRLDARRTLKGLVADLRITTNFSLHKPNVKSRPISQHPPVILQNKMREGKLSERDGLAERFVGGLYAAQLPGLKMEREGAFQFLETEICLHQTGHIEGDRVALTNE